MSRIGNKIVAIPAGVTLDIAENNFVKVKGPKGELSFHFDKNISFEVEGETVIVKRADDSKENKTIHGTTRALLSNMVIGVTSEFKKTLEIIGVGYKAQVAAKKLTLNAGYSHIVELIIPEGLKVECPKVTEVVISGCDKQLVGEFAANIRKVRKPEPYKGKGIRYAGEVVRRKEGKTAKK